jgi:hypothetical protein
MLMKQATYMSVGLSTSNSSARQKTCLLPPSDLQRLLALKWRREPREDTLFQSPSKSDFAQELVRTTMSAFELDLPGANISSQRR